MRPLTRRTVLSGATAAALGGCLHARPVPRREELVFGRLPSLSGAAAEAEVRPLADYLARALKRPVRVVTPPTYEETFRALERLEFDLVYLGACAYVRAERYGYEGAAVLLRRGTRLQRGLVFAPEDSPIHKLPDLPGHSFAFVDEASSTGWQFPAVLLDRVGVSPSSLKARFLGGHDAVVRAVLVERTFDAGACYEGAIEVALKWALNEGQAAPARILARTEQLPHAVFAVISGHPLALEIQRLLLGADRQPDAEKLLGPLQSNGFAPVDDRELEPARRVERLSTRLTPPPHA